MDVTDSQIDALAKSIEEVKTSVRELRNEVDAKLWRRVEMIVYTTPWLLAGILIGAAAPKA